MANQVGPRINKTKDLRILFSVNFYLNEGEPNLGDVILLNNENYSKDDKH